LWISDFGLNGNDRRNNISRELRELHEEKKMEILSLWIFSRYSRYSRLTVLGYETDSDFCKPLQNFP